MIINNIKSIILGAIVGISTCSVWAELTKNERIMLINAQNQIEETPEKAAEIIMQPDPFGNTPFYLAVKNGNFDLVYSFLTKLNKQEIFKIIMYPNESCDTPFLLTVRNKNLGFLKMLFVTLLTTEKAFEIIMETDDFGNTLLHRAAICNDLEFINGVLKDLTEDEASKIMQIRNNDGFTPLHLAAKDGYIDIVNALLKKLGKNVAEVIKIRDIRGYTALHWAIQNKKTKITMKIRERGIGERTVERIVEKKIIGEKDLKEFIVENCIEIETEEQDLAILNVLLNVLTPEEVFEINQAPNIEMFDYFIAKIDYYNTLIHFAAAESGSCLKALLEKLPQNKIVEVIMQEGGLGKATPLHLAIGNGNVASVDILLEVLSKNNKTFEAIMKQDKYGYTTVHYAVKTAIMVFENADKDVKISSIAIIDKIFMALPKDAIAKVMMQQDRFYYEPFDFVVNAINKAKIDVDEAKIDKAETKAKSTIKVASELLMTIVLYGGDEDFVKTLLNKLPKDKISEIIMEPNEVKSTLFHLCVFKATENFVKILLEYLSKDNKAIEAIMKPNRHGNTSLHLVGWIGSKGKAEMLLEYLAKGNKVVEAIMKGNKRNITPLRLAEKYKCQAIVDLFKRKLEEAEQAKQSSQEIIKESSKK